MKLKGKTAVITGAGSGIAKATAILFAKEGAKIVVVDVQDQNGRETVELIRKNGGEAFFFHADVRNSQEVKSAIDLAVEKFETIDILFSVAGIGQPVTPTEELSEELFDKVIGINLKGVFLSAKYVIPIMKKNGGGSIINMGSVAGIRPRSQAIAYAASKGGVINFTKGLALELAEYNIRVNCINPVVTNTPILKASEGHVDEYKATVPLGRIAEPEDMAYAALYLASEESRMVTGLSLNVDGGRSI